MKCQRFSWLPILCVLVIYASIANSQPRRSGAGDRHVTPTSVPVPGSQLEEPSLDPMWSLWTMIASAGVVNCGNCPAGVSIQNPFVGTQMLRRAGFDEAITVQLGEFITTAVETAATFRAERWAEICREPNAIATNEDLARLNNLASMQRSAHIRKAFRDFWDLLDLDGKTRMTELADGTASNRGPGFSLPPVPLDELPPVQETIARECARLAKLR